MSTTAPPPGKLPVPGHSSSSSSRRKDAFAALPALMSPARLGGGGSGLPSNSQSPSPTTGHPSPSSSNRPALSVDVRDQRSISDKRLPSLPAGSTLSSPPGRVPSVKPWALGAYDNKLVSSTLSHLPPLPPPSPGGMSTTGSNLSGLSGNASHLGSSPGYSSSLSLSTVHAQYAPQRTRTTSNPSNCGSGAGVLVLPNGTKLPMSDGRDNNTMHQALSHSSPNSPWSLLTVHVLPVFAGSPLKTPLEDLNNLCNSHILATSQRVAPSRLVAAFTADLRDFIASGMLTLNAKFETLEEGKIVARAAEVWNFFWGQILPYVEGVFLPFSQVRDVPGSSSTRIPPLPTIATPPIPVRQILLSGFLAHILLPLLPRLIPLLSKTAPPNRSSSDRRKQQQQMQQRGATDLPRLLQMSLVLATQAKYSAFFPMRDPVEADEETRDRVEELARAVRWSMGVAAGTIVVPDEDDVALSDAEAAQQNQYSQQQDGDAGGNAGSSTLKRGPSVSQAGRLRPPQRGGGSTAFHDSALNGHGGGAAQHYLSHHPNTGYAPPDARWRIGEMTDDEDDAGITPSTTRQSTVHSVAASAASTATTATGAASTVRGAESFATITDQRTPQDYGRRRHDRTYSSGESDLSSALSMLSRGGRKK